MIIAQPGRARNEADLKTIEDISSPRLQILVNIPEDPALSRVQSQGMFDGGHERLREGRVETGGDGEAEECGGRVWSVMIG